MNTSAFTILLSAIIFGAVAAEPEFECVLSAERASYKVGEAPRFSFSIGNKSTQDVVLVRSLDGSDRGSRYPRCRIEIRDAKGQPLKVVGPACGNTNPLRVADFVPVPAGKVFEPYGKGFFTPIYSDQFPVKTPGVYTFQCIYATSDRMQDYFGFDQQNGRMVAAETQELFALIPKIEIRSNELKLKFTPAAAKAK